MKSQSWCWSHLYFILNLSILDYNSTTLIHYTPHVGYAQIGGTQFIMRATACQCLSTLCCSSLTKSTYGMMCTLITLYMCTVLTVHLSTFTYINHVLVSHGHPYALCTSTVHFWAVPMCQCVCVLLLLFEPPLYSSELCPCASVSRAQDIKCFLKTKTGPLTSRKSKHGPCSEGHTKLSF